MKICACGAEIEHVRLNYWQRKGTGEVCKDNHWHRPISQLGHLGDGTVCDEGLVRPFAKPSPRAEPSESAGEREMLALIDKRDKAEDSLGEVYALVTGKQAEWTNLFGYTEAINEVAEVMSNVRQPPTLPQSSLQGHIKYLSDALLDKSNAATWGSRNGEPWLGIPTSVVRAIIESSQSQPVAEKKLGGDDN